MQFFETVSAVSDLQKLLVWHRFCRCRTMLSKGDKKQEENNHSTDSLAKESEFDQEE